MRPAGSATSRMMLSAETDFPQPDSPTSATVSPSLTSQETPSTARTAPALVMKVVLRSRTSSRFATALGYRVCSVKRFDLGGGKAELGEHLARMLAESRRGARHRARCRRKLDRQAQGSGRPGARVLELDHHLARERLRVARQLGDGVDRAAGHARGVQSPEQVILFPRSDPLAQSLCQRFEILHALGVAAKDRKSTRLNS